MKRDNLVLSLLGLAFAVAFFWSLWFDTIFPLIRQGDWAGLLFHLVGVPVILVGTGAIVYGGFRALCNMFDLGSNEEFVRHAEVIKARPTPQAVRAAQKAHLVLWGAALGRGAMWMLVGFLLIGVGGFLINW
jgi:hypothetical protein